MAIFGLVSYCHSPKRIRISLTRTNNVKKSIHIVATILMVWLCVFSYTLSGSALGQAELSSKASGTTVSDEDIHEAARQGDLEKIKSALAAGVEVDAPTRYGATALFFACDRGHREVVDFLLEKGADPNTKDTFYNATPMTWAQSKGHKDIVIKLLNNGGKNASGVLSGAITSNDLEYAKQILDTDALTKKELLKVRDSVLRIKDEDKQKKSLALFDEFNLPEPKTATKLTAEMAKQYEGKYKSDRFTADIEAKEDGLTIGIDGGDKSALTYKGEHQFSIGPTELTFEMKGGQVTALVMSASGNELKLTPVKKETTKKEPGPSEPAESKVTEAPKPKFGPSSIESHWADLSISSANWPGFRGNGARGVAEGQNPPVEWYYSDDADEKPNQNLKWRTEVPGLGLSCPTIWGDDIFITTAVAEGEDQGLKIGLYGDVDSVEDDREYEFKLMCFSKSDGRLKWEQNANKAKPAVKRHAKSSHANSTVATDGKHVVAFFGSEGLYCYSNTGEPIWKVDLGMLDSGWFYDPGYQWGFGSSPLIYKDRVIVQCDIQGKSFVAALDLETGNEVWRTERDEIPTWSSPTVHEFGKTAMLITGGTKSARGYDVKNGQLLWSLNGHSEIVVPTPFVAHNLIFLASGYSPIQPIYAIKPDARGDISLEENTTTNASIPWSVKRGGPYMPSPIVYGDYLYTCSNSGILACYHATTGAQVYKKRLRAPGGPLSFTASPLAADGHLYLPAEDGRMLVVKTGSKYKLAGVNDCNESVLATPAISDGMVIVRSQDSLMAFGKE